MEEVASKQCPGPAFTPRSCLEKESDSLVVPQEREPGLAFPLEARLPTDRSHILQYDQNLHLPYSSCSIWNSSKEEVYYLVRPLKPQSCPKELAVEWLIQPVYWRVVQRSPWKRHSPTDRVLQCVMQDQRTPLHPGAKPSIQVDLASSFHCTAL